MSTMAQAAGLGRVTVAAGAPRCKIVDCALDELGGHP